MQSGSNNVDEYIQKLPTWKANNLILFRKLVNSTVPGIEEDVKWGVPVFLLDNKMLFAMSSFKEHTKFNFMHNGALLNDKDKLFNNGLDSKKSRGIDLRENDHIDKNKLQSLIKLSAAQAKTT